jgi:MHS family proline/betaine transporter-like MFS transporter
VVSSAAIGQFIEWYDFVVYAYSAVVLAQLFFPSENAVAGLLSTFAVYAVGFVMRPIGGVVFGHLGDKYGRKNVLSFVILIMGIATLAIGFLPTYATIGVAAPILLVVCRLVQGLSAGGEAMGSNALVAEHAPAGRAGLLVGFCYSFAYPPAVFAALLLLGLTNVMGDDYSSWGWRIPFLLGGVISFFGLYIRGKVEESPDFEEVAASDEIKVAPSIAVLKDHRQALLYTFVVATLSGLGFYTLTGYFVSYLTVSVGLTSNQALVSNCIAILIAFVMTTLSGGASDRFGRRNVLLTGAALSCLAAVPAYQLAGRGDLSGAIAGQAFLALCLGVFFGPVGIAFLEHFPASVRFSGAAIGYNLAYIVFGGTAPLLSTWLVDQTGSLLAPAVYMAIVAGAVFVMLLILPRSFSHLTPTQEEEAR